MSYSDQLASRDQYGRMSWTVLAERQSANNALVANEQRLATGHFDEPSIA
jgi:hypothetical protein